MTFVQYLFLALLGIIVILNVIVTRGLLRDPSVSTVQRTIQCLLIWLLPLVGVLGVYGVMAHHHTKDEMKIMFPFPFNLIYREPIEPSGYRDISDGGGA